jgi:hypothetical protein
LINYSKKVLCLPEALSLITDSRTQPRIPTAVVARSAFSMFLARLGSLNALEQLKYEGRSLKSFIEADLPSADTIGRVFSLIEPNSIREAIHAIYKLLKRNKAIAELPHGLIPLNIDGHESHTSYLRHCTGCLERIINKGTDSEKIQFYHRNVVAQLVFDDFSLPLDLEPQLPGEDEIACAMRLFSRIVAVYSRAFDVVVADALYAKSNFFNLILAHGKDAMAVLKDERRDLFKDADALFLNTQPTCIFDSEGTQIECWDAQNFHSWPQVSQPVRVLRTRETKKQIRRQLSDTLEDQPVSSWTWVTTFSVHRAHTKAAVQIGHGRWKLENNGFNELVNHWFSDHVYKHESTAMLNFSLLCMIAYTVFRCFFIRNLKPVARATYTMLHIASEIKSELYYRPKPWPHPT